MNPLFTYQIIVMIITLALVRYQIIYRKLKKSGKRSKSNKFVSAESVDSSFKRMDRDRKKHPIYYFIHDVYYRIKHFVKETPLNVRTFLQRGKRGWGDSDVWGLSHYLSKTISETVKHLKENNHGHPCGLTEGKWIDILNEISRTFDLAKRMDENELYYIKGQLRRKKWQKTVDGINKKCDTHDRCMTDEEIKAYERGFDLFRKYFFNLWD